MRSKLAILWLAAAIVGCGAGTQPAAEPAPEEAAQVAPPPSTPTGPVVISIVGTNDLHGHIGALPLLGGYLANLRRARAADGAVVLLDGGDMFQGTLESNLEEGASVVRAYEALGYDAVAIGNHEFDYGPVGERSTVREPGEDPRGALNARIAEADYPFLNANLMRREGGEHAGIGAPSVMIERAGVSIGVIGVTTEQTLTTTISANVSDLAIRSLADAIASEAATLRERGAALVLVAAHAGGRCHHFESPDDLSSCDADQEIWQVAQALPAGTVDVIVAGHTHQGVAHRVNGIAIIESFSYGHAFGRVDVTLSRPDRAILDVHIHPPQGLCSRRDADPEGALERCAPPDYEGQDVMPDAEVAQVIEPSMTRAAALRDRDLGVVLTHAFTRDRSRENALGNLFTDLMLRARPSADVAVVNGGGLRANLAEGPLTYGELYESFPFDNRFATIRMPASELALMLGRHLSREGSFWSIGGLRARAVCRRGALDVSLVRENGRPVRPTEEITVLTSDFLATGGDGAFERAREREGAVTIEDDPPIREAMVEVLAGLAPRAHSGGSAPRPQLDPGSYYDRERPRVQFDGELPLRCSR